MHYVWVLHRDILRLYNRIIPVEKIIIVLKNGKTHSIFQQFKTVSSTLIVKYNLISCMEFDFVPPHYEGGGGPINSSFLATGERWNSYRKLSH